MKNSQERAVKLKEGRVCTNVIFNGTARYNVKRKLLRDLLFMHVLPFSCSQKSNLNVADAVHGTP